MSNVDRIVELTGKVNFNELDILKLFPHQWFLKASGSYFEIIYMKNYGNQHFKNQYFGLFDDWKTNEIKLGRLLKVIDKEND